MCRKLTRDAHVLLIFVLHKRRSRVRSSRHSQRRPFVDYLTFGLLGLGVLIVVVFSRRAGYATGFGSDRVWPRIVTGGRRQ